MKNKINLLDLLAKADEWLLLALAFFLPIKPIVVAICISLLLINWLIQKKWLLVLKLKTFSSPVIGIFIFYFLYLLGFIYSSNFEAGLFNVQVKLSIFLLPLLIVFNSAFDTSIQKKAFNAFTIGTCVMAIIFLALSAHNYYFKKQPFNDAFYYANFSRHIHPTYFALFCCTAFANCMLYLKAEKLNWIKKTTLVLVMFFLSGIVYLSSSRAGFLSLIIVAGFGLFYLLKNKWILSATIILLVGFGLILLKKNERFKILTADSKQVFSFVHSNSANISKQESGEDRFEIFSSAISIIKRYPIIGVGTGDDNDSLKAVYKQRNFTKAFDANYNSHNQFLQTALQLGILVSVFLLLFLFYISYQAIKTKNYLIGIVVFLFFINFLFESMLNVQLGTMYFGFVIGWGCKRHTTIF